MKENVRIEKLLQTRASAGQGMSASNALEETLVSIAGANIGGAGVVGAASGAPLVAAQRGAKYAREVTGALPLEKKQKILALALEEPQCMAQLLAKADDPKQQAGLSRFLYGLLMGLEPVVLGGVTRVEQEQRREGQEGGVSVSGS